MVSDAVITSDLHSEAEEIHWEHEHLMDELADLDSALDELGAGGLDVGDDEVQAPHGAGRRIRDPRADGYRARRARWRHLHDAKRIAGAVVDVQVEAHLLDVEGLGPVDIRDGQ